MNIATNNELYAKSMSPILQIMESSSGKELTQALLIQQLIQINSVVAAQTHTKMMNFLSITLKVVGILFNIHRLFVDFYNNQLAWCHNINGCRRRLSPNWIKSFIIYV